MSIEEGPLSGAFSYFASYGADGHPYPGVPEGGEG